MAFGRPTRREPEEASLDLSERLSPYEDPDTGPEPSRSHPAGRVGVDVRLVIVDDLPAIRTMMTLAVSLCDGIRLVGEAGSAAEAIEVCTRVQPDAILLDVEMPTMDGLEAIPLLRAAASSAKVAMYSNDDLSREASIDAGADAFFLKLDTRPTEVLDQIKQLFASGPL